MEGNSTLLNTIAEKTAIIATQQQEIHDMIVTNDTLHNTIDKLQIELQDKSVLSPDIPDAAAPISDDPIKNHYLWTSHGIDIGELYCLPRNCRVILACDQVEVQCGEDEEVNLWKGFFGIPDESDDYLHYLKDLISYELQQGLFDQMKITHFLHS